MGDHGEQGPGHNGLSSHEVEMRRATYGFNEIKDRSKKWPELLWNQVYGDHWYPNSIPAMMWVAIIVTMAIEDWADAGVILFLHTFNSLLGFYETLKAGDAVAALKSALAPTCNVKRDGDWRKIMARELVPGDLIMLKIGDVVAADGILQVGGTCDLDQSGLTGESLPVKKSPGDIIFAGTVVKRGEQDMIVEHIGEKTEMGKGVALIQSVDSKGQVEVIMNRITAFLLIFAVSMNVLLIIVEVTMPTSLLLCSTEQLSWNGKRSVQGCYIGEARKIVSNFVVLMVAAIPIATPVVVTATMALGARKMADAHAVVTRLSAIEELAGMTVLCSDKTGTLTKNVLTLDTPEMIEGTDPDDMIFKAALAAKAVDPDAIDKCVRQGVRNPAALANYTELEFLPFDPVAKRTEATLRGPDGKTFKVTKGAPQVIVKMAKNCDKIAKQVQAGMEMFAGRGLRPVGVAETDANGDWIFLGLISLFDPPRDDTQATIENALLLGASVKMITGDHLLIAKETCRRLGMGDSIMGCDTLNLPRPRLLELVENVDGFAEVFPEHKFDIVALFQERGHITGMTGDGVNDAPALRKANVGFAVEGATPAAQGAAAVILLTPGLSVIITAIKRSRKIFQRLQNYLIYRVFMSVFLLTFFFISIIWAHLDFPPLIIILMCLILDLSTMSLAYDKVVPSPLPNKWNLPRIIAVASVLGLVACFGNIVFLHMMRENLGGLGEYQRGMSTLCSYGQDVHCHSFDQDATPYKHEFPYHYTAPPGMNPCGPLGDPTKCAWTPPFTDKVPAHGEYPFNLQTGGPWDPETFPYSAAVENTVLFLSLCLTSQLAVLSARVEGFFFSRRPGYVLLTIISVQMVCTTIVAAAFRLYPFWDPNSSLTLIRLTRIDGRYIGACWLFSIILFFIMEGVKFATYKVFALANAREERNRAAVKQREDLRRRMTATRATLSHGAGHTGAHSAAASHGAHGAASHGGSLAPTPMVPSAAYRPSQSKPRKGGELGKPLLADDDNYAL